MSLTSREKLIIKSLSSNAEKRISEIKDVLGQEVSIPTLNRDLKKLVDKGILIKSGKGRAITYRVSPSYRLLDEEIGDSYFDKDVDQRTGNKRFDPETLCCQALNYSPTKNSTTWQRFMIPI